MSGSWHRRIEAARRGSRRAPGHRHRAGGWGHLFLVVAIALGLLWWFWQFW